MSRILLFNKPYGVLCQFSPGDTGAQPARLTLKDFITVPDVYPAGRLDADSEGLLILTDDGRLQHRISDPLHKLPKLYWAQVEGAADEDLLQPLRAGLDLGDYRSRPALAQWIDEPSDLWPRQPPIRQRKHIPTAWLALTLSEGKNRQVRKMTAKIGRPTLRLIRYAVGEYNLTGLAPGQWREL